MLYVLKKIVVMCRPRRGQKRIFCYNRYEVNAATEDHVDVTVLATAAKLDKLERNCEVPLQEPSQQPKDHSYAYIIMWYCPTGLCCPRRPHELANPAFCYIICSSMLQR